MNSNNDVLICFVLDASGSMIPVTSATCEGFNQFKSDQKNQEGEALMTLTLFNTEFDTRYVATPLEQVSDLGWGGNGYLPGGMTALFDAVGESIKKTETWVNENGWVGRVMVVVLTDGEENRSRYWHVNNPRVNGDAFDVAGLIDWKSGEGWDFIFLGAGGTDWLERTFKNVSADAFFAYAGDAVTTRGAYKTVAASVTQSRVTGQSLNSALADQRGDKGESS